MLKIKTFTFNMFGVNTYIVWNPDTREAAIIDPGMINEDEQLALARFTKINLESMVRHAPTTHSSENVPQHNVACSACPKAYPW